MVEMGRLRNMRLTMPHRRATMRRRAASPHRATVPIPSAIAIDGPVASGKTSVGRRLAQQLGYRFLDTGLMYRAVTLWALMPGGPGLAAAAGLGALANQRASEAGELALADDGDELRTPEIGQGVSLVARVPQVRRALVAEQRRIAAQGEVVMVGRDIGTVVLPQAAKVYLDAPLDVRVERRRAELAAQGQNVDAPTVREEVQMRDRLDSERADSPLASAPDARVVATAGLDVDGVVERILAELGA